jgi:hypothetical protein
VAYADTRSSAAHLKAGCDPFRTYAKGSYQVSREGGSNVMIDVIDSAVTVWNIRPQPVAG